MAKAAGSGAVLADLRDLRPMVAFLLDRLDEFSADNLTDETARDWFGHVEPAAARLRAAIGRDQGSPGGSA